MALNKYMLGELITPVEETNERLEFTEENVRGISIQKKFIPTKADMTGVSLRPYLVIRPDTFCYVTVTSRNGEKISIARNDTQSTFIVSSSYAAFRVTRKDVLNSEFLFMMFNRPEFDRFARFNSWGSARETFDFADFKEMEIELPELPIQEKFVRIYKSMVANRDTYETRLDEMQTACVAYIEELRRNMKSTAIGPYIRERSERNEGRIDLVLGVDASSRFVPTKANMADIDTAKYKIVRDGEFAYNPSRINLGSIALRKGPDCIVSPMYEIFEVDKEHLLPEYLLIWLTRREFLRSTLFYAVGSVRDTFDLDLMKQVEIPIPDMDTQKAIAAIHETYFSRRRIFESLKARVVNLCPILIRGATKEGERA